MTLTLEINFFKVVLLYYREGSENFQDIMRYQWKHIDFLVVSRRKMYTCVCVCVCVCVCDWVCELETPSRKSLALICQGPRNLLWP